MALNLKRKREKDTGSRKTRKVTSSEEKFGSNDFDGMDDSDMANDEPDDELEGREGPDLDEGDWDGITAPPAQEGDADAAPPGTKPKKPPTGEELRTIKDATELFRSSSFKLQIDALLPNVRPKASRTPPLDRFLLTLHTFLMSLPSVSPQHPLEASRSLSKKGVAVPYSLPLPSEDTNWKVAFERPSDITLVGSWANKVSVKGKDGGAFGVDLAVEMPESLFQEKDYLNGRFFHKRAFYLAIITAAIKSATSDLSVDLSYDSLSGNPRLTKLVLCPRKDDSANDFTKLNARICIFPVLPSQSPIPIHRLSPSHSNIRISTSSPDNDKPTTVAGHEPTPLYNTALLTSLMPRSNLLATHTLSQNSPAFSDALTLLRVWANQRGYGEGTRMCVMGFEGKGPWWAAVLGVVIAGEEYTQSPLGKGSKRKPLGRGLSSYQLFRAALDFLANHNFETTPVYLRTKDGHRFPPEEYQGNHTTVFVDSSSTINLLSGVPLGSLDLLRYDAQKTLETLNHAPITRDPFTEVFLKEQRDLPRRFDTTLRVDLSSAKPREESLQTTLDCGSPANALLASLTSLLRQGLANRTTAVTILRPPPSPRSILQAHPSNPDIIHIGLIYNPEHAFRLVDHGPAADEPDKSIADRFRDFWGDKAELRRFKDGRIVESVVWDVKTADERAHVPAMIVRHVLQRHFGIEEDAVLTWQTSFDSVLRLPESISGLYQSSGVPTGFKSATTAFDSLVKGIKALDDELPLAILNISAVSEYLRYTSVFTPVPLPTTLASSMPSPARYLPPMEIILEFEKSSKWPDDLRAIQKVKLAFMERIATVLMTSMDGVKATVVVGDGVGNSEIQDKARLEIITPEGWAFSARIWHDREATLLDRIVHNKSALPHITPRPEEKKGGKELRDAVEAKEIYTQRFIHAPRHHRAIVSLCHHFSAYPGTVRLVKRWLASHWLLHGHITEEAVEIICASLFFGDGRGVGAEAGAGVAGGARPSVPGSKERGFATVIEFLKDWKWEEGLFVQLYGDAESGLSTDAPTVSVVAGSKAGVWAISTEADKEGHIWTSHGPDLVIAHRVRALAKATWDHLQGMEQGSLQVKTIFTHPTQDYDLIINLDPSILPRYFQNYAADPNVLFKRGKYANLREEETSVSLRPGFDPACLLFKDLKRIYADTLKIFHDPFGGDQFGAIWDPTLKNPRPFRVLGGFSSMPTKKENEKSKDQGLVVLNESAVLSEIERLGLGLIKDITVHV